MRRIANIGAALLATGIYAAVAYGISGEPPKSFGDWTLVLLVYMVALHSAKNDAWN